MQGRMVKDVTQDCWQRRRVEEKIKTSLNIMLQPVGGQHRNLIISIFSTRSHMLYSNINIPLVKIMSTEEGLANLVED